MTKPEAGRAHLPSLSCTYMKSQGRESSSIKERERASVTIRMTLIKSDRASKKELEWRWSRKIKQFKNNDHSPTGCIDEQSALF